MLAGRLAGRGVERFGRLQTDDQFGFAFEKLRAAWVAEEIVCPGLGW